MRYRPVFRSVSNFVAAAAALAMLALLLATIYFTWFELQWTTFFAGILAAAVISIVSRVSHSEWLLARRSAQVSQLRSKLNAEQVLRKRSDDQLASVRANVRHLDESLPAGVAFIDPEGVVRYHNRAFRLSQGLTADRIDGRPLADVLGAAAWGRLGESVTGALALGRNSTVVRAAGEGGADCACAVHVLPLESVPGGMAGAYLLQVESMAAAELPRGLEPPPPQGRTIYANTLNETIMNWDHAATRLRQALDRDEFCLYGQRIRGLEPTTAPRHLLELLVRLREEEDQLIPPGTFLPLVEEHGLMPELDRWVVRHLLDWAQRSPSRLETVYSINVAPATIADGTFPDYVREQLASRGMLGSLLCFEVPEPEAATGLVPIRGFVERVRAAGCLSALCGFGRTLESFDQVAALPVDFLKVDAGIVLRLATSPVDQAKLKAIVRIARETRRRTIAECVEDTETISRLRRLGVDYAQGFAIGRPEPLENEAPAHSEHVLAAVD
ncbi:MAG: EAL domain-containing protein [Betaproteobacteria bacterium]|nr:EAL domain-containing protein [Betaproteobacteria bacterium]